MSKKTPLVGKNFYKYEEHRGIEAVYVIDYHKKTGRYLVAFSTLTPEPGDRLAQGVGPIKGSLAHVASESVEAYAQQDQKKLKLLLKNEKKHRKLGAEIEAEMHSHQAPENTHHYDSNIPF